MIRKAVRRKPIARHLAAINQLFYYCWSIRHLAVLTQTGTSLWIMIGRHGSPEQGRIGAGWQLLDPH
jgi:hypothetical protein